MSSVSDSKCACLWRIREMRRVRGDASHDLSGANTVLAVLCCLLTDLATDEPDLGISIYPNSRRETVRRLRGFTSPKRRGETSKPNQCSVCVHMCGSLANMTQYCFARSITPFAGPLRLLPAIGGIGGSDSGPVCVRLRLSAVDSVPLVLDRQAGLV